MNHEPIMLESKRKNKVNSIKRERPFPCSQTTRSLHAMESNKKDSDKEVVIPEHLECSICGQLFDKAVSLKACGHTYCSVCIRSHWLTTSLPGVHRQSKKECPRCRTPAGHDVNSALVINREIQQAAKEFADTTNLSKPSYANGAISLKDELPINKRIQSRNYAGIKRNGKKELQKICKEYNISTSGNEQELVDRLRSFECMWNAELDSIDTPLRPSEFVAKFKEKEKQQREAKSKEMFDGSIHHHKYLKKMTSSLLDEDNKRNDKMFNQTSSGNAIFDAKIRSSFSDLIKEARKSMKKKPNKKVGPRTYADDDIHDGPKRKIDNENTSETATRTTDNESSTKDESSDNPTETKSSVGNSISPQNKKRCVYNPYKSDRKKSIQNPYMTEKTKQPVGKAGRIPFFQNQTIHDPSAQKQILPQHQAPTRKFDPKSLPQNSGSNLPKVQPIGHGNCRDRTPLSRANNLGNFATNMSTVSSVSTDGAGSKRINNSSSSTPRKKILFNPYSKQKIDQMRR